MRPLASNKQAAEFDEELDSEILIIHAQDDLIEKCLGVDESLIVAKSSIVAFEDGISFSEVSSEHILPGERKHFVKAYGPGILYIETSRE